MVPSQENIAVPGAAIVGAMVGFLFWNRPPAKIFLGDVGSIPLGFFLGWILLYMVIHRLWVPALILPLYYMANPAIAMAKDVLKKQVGSAIWFDI